MYSRHSIVIGWAMSRCSAWPSPAGSAPRSTGRTAGFKPPPHWLQKRLRTTFRYPHLGQGSLALSEGIATKSPFVPSITFTFLTTKECSNVIVAYAFSLLSADGSRRKMRTSVISTAQTPVEATVTPHPGSRRRSDSAAASASSREEQTAITVDPLPDTSGRAIPAVFCIISFTCRMAG